MSTINATAYSPENIGEIKFRIPLYQRPYAWETNQVSQLLKDLFVQFEKEKNENYYIGILSVGKTDIDDNLYDLIDGQQRITTLMLIGRVLSENHEKWKAFLSNRLDLYGREEDKKYLETLDNSLNPYPKMVEAIKLIREFLFKNKQADFPKYVFEKASFFISEVPEDYTVIEKNLQFVRMNNRGKQLEAHDILKIKLASFYNIENDEAEQKRKDFVKAWNEISQLGCSDEKAEPENQESIGKNTLGDLLNDYLVHSTQPKESEIFYQSIVSYPEFLLIALERFNYNTVEYPKYISVSHRKEKLLEEFGFGEKKLEFEWDATNVQNFLEALKKQLEAFNKYFIKRDKNEAYKFKRKEDSTDAFNVVTEPNEIEKIKVFQSYLYVSREAHNWMKKAFDYVVGKTEKVFAFEFLEELKKNDNEFKNADSTSLTYEFIDRYWLWRLDYYLWENRNEIFKNNSNSIAVATKYVFRSNRSIEHISPQNPESNNNVIIGNNLNWFGNLAMISSEKNSSLKNKSFEVKRAHVEAFINESKNGSIESLKLLKIFDYQTWSEGNVISHGNEMIDILINSFPDARYEDIMEKLSVQKKAPLK